MEIDQDLLCEFCMERIGGHKILSPTNPTCEGRWCEEAEMLYREEVK